MSRLLPSDPDVEDPEEPRVVGLDSDAADDFIGALSSNTARRILAALHEDPASPARLAERVDTSLQNVQYHLGNLEEAGLVEVGDTVYSEKGREMNVYVPADRALVVVAGREEETTGLKAALSRLLGGVGILGVASVVVDRLARRAGVGFTAAGGAGGDAGSAGDGGGAATGADGSPEPTPTPTEAATQTPSPTTTETTANGGGPGIAEATTTPSPTGTPTEVATATRTEAATGTSTEVATATQTPLPTGTSTPTATPTSIPTEEPTQTATEAAATQTPTPTPTPELETAATVTEAASGAVDGGVLASVAASPGLLFFLGGTTVLVAGFAVWWLRAYR